MYSASRHGASRPESTASALSPIPDDGPSSSRQGHGRHESAVSDELLRAADSDTEKTPDLMSKGAKPDARTDDGDTPLHLLVIKGASEDALRDVLKTMTQEQIDSLNGGKDTALSIAIALQDMNAARVLLDHNASPTREEEQFPPLNRACYLGNEDMARLLIRHGANLETRDQDRDFTPLEHAIRRGSKPLASLLLDKGANVNAAENSDGWTPLMTACSYGDEEIVALLVKKGADVKKPKRDSVTPLHIACRLNLQKSIELLIGHGADANAVDDYGRTPLYTASGYVDAAVVELLQKHKVDINAASGKGRTPLAKAVRRENRAVVDFLIEAEADVNIADNDGRTPLIVAICQQNDHIVKQLLAKGTTNVNAAENEGWTPLMLAGVAGKTDYVKRLLERGASVDVPNHAGHTALHKASSFGNGEIVRILLENGRADPIKVDKVGQTALHKASRRGYKDIVEQLLVTVPMKDKDGASMASMANMVNMADKGGWTALHHATCRRTDTDDGSLEDLREPSDKDWILDLATASGDHRSSEDDPRSREEVVRCLLTHGANAAARAKDSQTPLHLAASSGFSKEIIEHLANNMDWGGAFAADDFEHQVLGWAAENRERHEIARLLLKKSKRAAVAKHYLDSAKNQSDWNALDWAAYTGDARIVWLLLYSMEPTRENDRNRERALEVAEAAKNKLEATDSDGDRGLKRPKRVPRGGALAKFPRKWGDIATQKDADHLLLKTDEYERTIDLLRDPPFVPTSLPSERIEKPKLKPIMSDFDAVIADFYAKGSQTGFLHRRRRVGEVMGGPGRIMAEAKDWINDATSPRLNKAGGEKVFAEDDFRFRWIHLPANNVRPNYQSSCGFGSVSR